MDGTHWRANSKLVAKYVNRSAETIDWLEKMGVKFQLLDINFGDRAFNQTGHIVCTPDGLKLRGGVTNWLIKAMISRARELGVAIVTNTELVDIVKEDGRITHAIVKNVVNNEEIDYNIKA